MKQGKVSLQPSNIWLSLIEKTSTSNKDEAFIHLGAYMKPHNNILLSRLSGYLRFKDIVTMWGKIWKRDLGKCSNKKALKRESAEFHALKRLKANEGWRRPEKDVASSPYTEPLQGTNPPNQGETWSRSRWSAPVKVFVRFGNHHEWMVWVANGIFDLTRDSSSISSNKPTNESQWNTDELVLYDDFVHWKPASLGVISKYY